MRKTLTSLLLLAAFSLAGCGVIDALGASYADIDTDPSTPAIEAVAESGSPAGDIIDGAARVATNLTDIEGWLKLLGGASVLILAGVGTYKVRKRILAKKNPEA